jgi:hypothetical protein
MGMMFCFRRSYGTQVIALRMRLMFVSFITPKLIG